MFKYVFTDDISSFVKKSFIFICNVCISHIVMESHGGGSGDGGEFMHVCIIVVFLLIKLLYSLIHLINCLIQLIQFYLMLVNFINFTAVSSLTAYCT